MTLGGPKNQLILLCIARGKPHLTKIIKRMVNYTSTAAYSQERRSLISNDENESENSNNDCKKKNQ